MVQLLSAMKLLLMSHDFPLIIADESVDARIIRSLTDNGYTVYAIITETPGITDSKVIEIAIQKSGYIITEDKDFGDELVYKRIKNIGSMLLRFQDSPIDVRIHLILEALSKNANSLHDCFSVLTSKKLRIRQYISE